jgi:hypothetical protein
MDRVIDHNFLMQALFGLQYILGFVENHKNLIETELETQLKENANYKYKNINVIKDEINSEVHKLLRKLQQFTKMEYLHYLCVVDFTRNKKTILALKSLTFLRNHSKNSHYYMDAMTVFSQYFTNSSTSVIDSFKTMVLNEFPELKSKNSAESENGTLIKNFSNSGQNELLLQFVSLKNSSNKDFNSFKEKVSKIDQLALRKVPFNVTPCLNLAL